MTTLTSELTEIKSTQTQVEVKVTELEAKVRLAEETESALKEELGNMTLASEQKSKKIEGLQDLLNSHKSQQLKNEAEVKSLSSKLAELTSTHQRLVKTCEVKGDELAWLGEEHEALKVKCEELGKEGKRKDKEIKDFK